MSVYGMFLPDGNTIIPTGIFNLMVDELRNEYFQAREVARSGKFGREFRLQNARLATVCRRALRTLNTHEYCRAQTRIV